MIDPDLIRYLQGIADLKSGGALKVLEDYARARFIPILHKEAADVLLYFIGRESPRRILELGTAMGYSAILMARSDEAITIDTMERDPDMIQLARANLRAFALEERVTIHEGDIDDRLDDLSGPYDLIFIDAGKSHYRDYFYRCLEKLNPGGMIICDNILVRGLVAKEFVERKHSTIIWNMRGFIEEVSTDPRFWTTLLPVGDGLFIIHCKE